MFFEKFSINKKNYAFTLAELMIVLGLIGVVAALSMPQLYRNLPRQETEMRRKITYTLEQTVANMFEDETMYPKSSNDSQEGFKNTGRVYVNGVSYEGNTKFCQLFASKFNRVNRKNFFAAEDETSAALCTAEHATPTDATVSSPTFISSDGAYWYLPITTFPNGFAQIVVDVNGSKGPNCSISSGAACADAIAKAAAQPDRHPLDRYVYFVKHNGTVTLNGPTTASNNARLFDIQVNVTTKDTANNDVNPASTGGVVTITDCDTTGTNCGGESAPGEYNGNTVKFENLSRGHVYLLRSNPNPLANAANDKNYTSTWANNQKNILIGNQDVTTSLTFREIPRSSIFLTVSGCPNASCGSVSLYRNCRYVHVTSGNGTFKYDALRDTYSYAGLNDPGADYDYRCDNTPISGSSESNTYSWNGLQSGNYKIEVVPSNTSVGGYTIPNIRNNRYIQSVRLGTKDVEFFVSFERVVEEEP